jgi:hypothetical protein
MNSSWLIKFFLFLAVITPLPAYAYFDPGAGAVVIQLLVAAALGMLYRLRSFIVDLWRSIVDLLQSIMRFFR